MKQKEITDESCLNITYNSKFSDNINEADEKECNISSINEEEK
jgi:hypothetical protein